MKRLIAICLGLPCALSAQVLGKFPADSLYNTKVIPHNTSVIQVVGQMRNFASALGVRCQYCHVGEEGLPLEKFDFITDQKRTKVVAREMMKMVQEVNRRLDSLPGRPSPAVQVTCNTCHRGTSRPMPLSQLVLNDAMSAGADSAVRSYKALRERYYGRDAYDFGEPSLNTAAFRLGSAKKFPEALAILALNETYYPHSSNMYVFRGNINLMKGDTTAAATAFREALRLDPKNGEAAGRLKDIGQQP